MKYTAFLLDVVPHLAADPSEPVTVNAIKNAAIEFCKKSWIWREYTDPISLKKGVYTYDLSPNTSADISAVVTARLNDQALTPARQDELDEQLPNWQTVPGTPKKFSQLDTATILMAPLPDIDYPKGLVLSLALQPLRSSDELPDWIATQYWEGIALGAVAKLMLMTKKPWSDPQTGLDKRQQFEAAIGDAKDDVLKGLSRAATRTTPQH